MSSDSKSTHPGPPWLAREANAQFAHLQEAFERVVRSGRFLFGAELEGFEHELALSVTSAHAVGVGSGTDALELALRALDVGPGDEVITQAHSSPFTTIAIHAVGARPVYVDSSEDDFGMDPEELARSITTASRAVLPVHLYGQPVCIEEIVEVARRASLHVVEDCAQAQGATVSGKPVGRFGTLGCFSFYPTKNLGSLGDGGAVVTDDAQLARRVRSLRNGGLVAHGIHGERGVTSRLSELQAAFLRVRLRELEPANEARREHARAYARSLTDVHLPIERPGSRWAPHQYVVRHPRRDAIRVRLAERGIPLLVHYPRPVHLQGGFEDERFPAGSLPRAERLAAEVLSLPTHPFLFEEEREHIVESLGEVVATLG